MLAKLGVVPQQIAGRDIYSALERGTIDAAEWVGPYDDEKLGFARVAKYYYYPGFWEGTAQLSLVVNQKQWDSLPAEYKAAVESAAAEANSHMLAQYDTKNPNAMRKLVSEGAQLRAFPRPVMEAAYKAAFELYDELSAKSPEFKKIYGRLAQVPRRRIPLVPRRRAHLRQLRLRAERYAQIIPRINSERRP